jgi:very-short-patch-repair endonuclease
MVTIGYVVEKFRKCDSDKENRVIFTDNHPFLINGQWKEAKDILIGDRARILATKCKHCGKAIPFTRWRDGSGYEANYCSATCQANGLQEKYGKDYLLNKFRENGKALVENNQHHFQTRRREIVSLANSENSRRKYNTIAEQVLSEAMKNAGLEFVHQHKINRPEKRRCGNNGIMNCFYKTDFYFPEHKLAIECDGQTWRRDVEYDENRINYIKSTGVDVLQFKNDFIINHTDECVKAIQRIVRNHSGNYDFMDVTVSSVSTETRNYVTLYNLSVENDESYVARNFVVHNCQCVLIPLYSTDDPVMPSFTRDPYAQPWTREELPLIGQIVAGEL